MSGKGDKFAAMLGFAVRAGKIVYGIDNLKTARRLKLLAVSDGASDNLSDGMKRIAERQSVTLVEVKSLEELVGYNCKALGITDENMANAMIEYADGSDSRYRILP